MELSHKEVNICIAGLAHCGVYQFFQAFEFVGKGEKDQEINSIEFRKCVIEQCLNGIIELFEFVKKVKKDEENIPFNIDPLKKVIQNVEMMQLLQCSIDIRMDKFWKEIILLIQDVWFNTTIQKYNCPPHYEDSYFLSFLIPHLSKFLSVEYIPTKNDVHFCHPSNPILSTHFVYNDTTVHLSTWTPSASDFNEINIGSPSIIIIPICLDSYCYEKPEGNGVLKTIQLISHLFTSSNILNETEGLYIILIKRQFDELLKKYPLKNCFPQYDGSKNEIDFIKEQFHFEQHPTKGEVGFIVSNVIEPNSLLKIPRAIYPISLKKAKRNETICLLEEMKTFKVFDYHFKENKKVKCKAGMISLQGKRPTNEDTEVIKKLITKDKIAIELFAIFDGHGGIETSHAAIGVIENQIINNDFLKTKMFEKMMDEVFNQSDNILCKKVLDNSGCTAAVVIVFGRFLICGNVGDSEILIISEGKQYEVLSTIHKVNSPEEKERLAKLGVPVLGGRMYGSLAISRAFGDKQYKGDKNAVIPTPYVNIYELTKKDKAFVIACDGVFETLTYEDVVDWVATGIQLNKEPTKIAENITNDALERGSKDNISMIVSLLKWK